MTPRWSASTAVGPQISGGSITAIGNAVGLGATAGAHVSNITLTRTDPTNNASVIGVNILNATGVTVTGVTASGFATGVSVALTNTAPGPVITGSITAVTSCITLGGSTGATVTGVAVSGQLRAGATAIATTGVEIGAATGVTVTGLTATDIARGVNAPVTNTSTGLTVSDSTIGLTDAGAATGVNLGATDSALVSNVTVTGTARTVSRTTGITTNRASGATIEHVTISSVATGIGAVWVRLSGTSIPGHTITDATITDVGIGIYTANTTGTTVTASTVDAYGEGIAGHEDADITVTGTVVTGHTGSTFQNGTNCIRFYYTDGITLTDLTTSGGATGLYLDMSYNAVVTRLDTSGATWYATYAESITGYQLRDSTIHDNAGIGNLTINPTSLDAIDHRQVSSGITFEDNTFSDNIAGLYLPLGAFDVTFARNTVTGTSTYVILGTPIHDLTVTDNHITYTHDPALMSFADMLSGAPSLGDPPPIPPLPDSPEDAAAPFAAAARASAAAVVAPMSATPPANATATIWIAPLWFNLDTDTASSDGVQVLDNVFASDGPFIGVGTVGTVDKGTPDAPTDPSTLRTLRDTIDVSRNVFPKDSTAIVTVDNAEQGTDGNADNTMINGDAAVDARGDNDWGSPCYARVPTDGYDGGGAYIHELRTTQVLYPQACDEPPGPPGPPTPPGPPAPGPVPEPGGGSTVTGSNASSVIADTGSDVTRLLAIVVALFSSGAALLMVQRRRARARR